MRNLRDNCSCSIISVMVSSELTANPSKSNAAKRFFVWLLGIDYDPDCEADKTDSSRSANTHKNGAADKQASAMSNQHSVVAVTSVPAVPPNHKVNLATSDSSPPTEQQHISSVEQSPRAKRLLGFLFMLILTVDILNYLYFSIATKHKYPPPA